MDFTESLLYFALVTVLVLFPVPAEVLLPFIAVIVLVVLSQSAVRDQCRGNLQSRTTQLLGDAGLSTRTLSEHAHAARKCL